MALPASEETRQLVRLFGQMRDINVVEVKPKQGISFVSTVEGVVKDFEADGDSRTFVVRVRGNDRREPNKELFPKPSTSDPAYLQNAAELLLRHEEFLLARNIFSYLLKGNIRNPQALKGLGISLYRMADVNAATRCFSALAELYRSDDAFFWLATCYATKNNDLEAIRLFGRVTLGSLSERDRFNYYKELGNCQLRSGSMAEAKNSYLMALRFDPSSDTVYVNLGMLEIEAGNPKEAQVLFDKAVELNSKNSKALVGMAMLSVKNSELVQADTQFCKALKLDPLNQSALLHLINLAQKTRQFEAAKYHSIRFLELDPKNREVRYGLASLLFQEGNWEPCEREVDQLLKHCPNFDRAKQLKCDLIRNRKATL